MKILATLVLQGPDPFDLYKLGPIVRQEFLYEKATVSTAPEYIAIFEGRLTIDEPLYEWAQNLAHTIWRGSGRFLSTKLRSRRLLHDVRAYPEYIEHVFDDEGEYDAMKIEEAKKALVNPWPELEPHIIDQELSVVASEPKSPLRLAIESFFDPAEVGRLNRNKKR